MFEFTCNICGRANRHPGEKLDRERPSCSSCGSNVRTRALLQALSLELFGANLTLPDFPRVRSIRGMGASDSLQYADRLADRFDYRNTFHDRAPQFDIADEQSGDPDSYDFLIASEVFEHVAPPEDRAFRNVLRLLKPHGVLVFTVPYSLELTTAEHFPDLHEFGVARLGDRAVLVNRTREGEMQVFQNLVFHRAGTGEALEMREFSETGLKCLLSAAGFAEIRIYSEDYPAFGICHAEAYSLPIAARKGPFMLTLATAREMAEQYRDLKQAHDGEMRRLCKSLWFRVGHKLGLV
jgi:SAM-dependent methyltransferase